MYNFFDGFGSFASFTTANQIFTLECSASCGVHVCGCCRLGQRNQSDTMNNEEQ